MRAYVTRGRWPDEPQGAPPECKDVFTVDDSDMHAIEVTWWRFNKQGKAVPVSTIVRPHRDWCAFVEWWAINMWEAEDDDETRREATGNQPQASA